VQSYELVGLIAPFYFCGNPMPEPYQSSQLVASTQNNRKTLFFFEKMRNVLHNRKTRSIFASQFSAAMPESSGFGSSVG
jgi:hypothetical protein